MTKETDVVVIGSGPGGYTAAFRLADLGLKTILVDARKEPGGECLHNGCIPSKALLHVSGLLEEIRSAEQFGVQVAEPTVDLKTLREWKNGLIDNLSSGIVQLGKRRGVEFVDGRARFDDTQTLMVEGEDALEIRFKHAILATGSRPLKLPGFGDESGLVMDSTEALALEVIPQTLLVVGGGYIGLELGTVYAALGSKVTLVELTDGLLPGVDRDLVRPLERRIKQLFEQVNLNTKVTSIEDRGDHLQASFEGDIDTPQGTFERMFVAVGRRPNSDNLGLENTRASIDNQGFVGIDAQCRSADPSIFAIGDVAGQPMLAHKAMREGKVAAEVIAGQASSFDNQAIPAVVFTDPEISWCGLTEEEAKREGKQVQISRFPWSASGRAATLGRTEGLTKMISEPETGRILGVGIVGSNAGELIAEAVLAVEMAAVAEDIGMSIHPHPTLSETLGEAAEALLGRATHISRRASTVSGG
jgi:dihydrolipoamide dehydrogenase